MDEGIGRLIAGIIGIGVAVFVIWTAAVALMKAASFLVYVIPVVVAVAVIAGAVFSLLTTSWVLWGGGAPLPLTRDPNKVVAKEVFRREPSGPSKAYGWDWAWPSYLPYQVFEDAKANYASQLALIARYWSTTFARINVNGLVIQIIGYPITVILLGLFSASALAVMAITFVVMAVPFACAMLVRWAIIYLLRGLDVAYRTIMRSSAKCPECYEPTTLPSFECSNGRCAQVHRDVRPGRLGVLVRRCGCGTALPTTVVRASFAKLRAKCPSCNAYLTAGAGTRRIIQVPVFGTTASGKTRFMLAATVGLDRKLGEQGGSLTGTGPESQGQLENARQLIAQRANTVKTDAKLPQAFGLIATPVEGRPVELHLFDAAGELFDTWDSSANLRYLQSAEALVFVIDPLTTPAARASLERQGSNAVAIGSGSPGDAYDNAVEHLRAAGADLKNKSLAVVLTKADVLLTLPVAGDLHADDESSIHEWLVEQDLDSLMQRAELDFKLVKYFIADSLHSTPPSSPLSPYLPLAWLLRTVKANVVRQEGDQPSSSQTAGWTPAAPTHAAPIPQNAGNANAEWRKP